MSCALASLVKQVYCPPLLPGGLFTLEAWAGTDAVRHFRLGRHALQAALHMLNLAPGALVALPAFICRDLLGAVAAAGGRVCLYPVDERLVADLRQLPPDVRALVAVNYFGFAQDLSAFRDFSARTGAVLIEDNAHGLLSRDADGKPLGCRATLGLFSLRKTVALSSGGALVVNDPGLHALLPPALPPLEDAEPGALRLKRLLRHTVPLFGVRLCRAFVAAVRTLRRLRTGHAIPPTDAESETRLPMPATPSLATARRIAAIDVEAEIGRRRALYLLLEEQIAARGGQPVFSALPEGTSPYVFPFRCADREIVPLRAWLKQAGLECHRWPDLPAAVCTSPPAHYTNVWMVALIW